MGRFIVKLDDYYLEWSTIVDAPITYGMKLKEFKEFYKDEYGNRGMEELPKRLERVENQGVSAYHPYNNLENLITGNRAGDNEEELTKQEIIKGYCIDRPED